MVTSLFTSSSTSLPSISSNSKRSTYVPRYPPMSSPPSGNNIQSASPLPSTSKNSHSTSNRRKNNNSSSQYVFPPPFTPPPAASGAASTSIKSMSECSSSKSSPSCHSMASLTPSMSPSYTQKMARREKRHFQSSSPSTLSNYSSSSLVQSSPNKKSTKGGGVTFSSQSLSFLNRSAPVTTESKTAATEVTVPSSTAKPKDKFLSRRRSLPFTTQSLLSLDSKGKSSSTELPVANASASVSTTPMLLLSEKPVPNIDAKPILTTLPTTASSRDERNHGKLRASLRNRISTWASSVRQSFTAAHHHHQQQQYRSSSSDASASPKTAKKGEGMVMPLPSESHSMLSSKELSSFTLSCAPAQMSSANKETELAAERITTGIVLPLTSPKEGIDGTRTNLSSSFQLPPTQETYDGDDDKGRGDQEDDEQQEEKLTRRRHYELSHDPVKSFSTLPLERTLKVVEAPSQYPIAATEAAPSAIPAIVRTFAHPAQYIPMNTSAAGRPKHHTSFKTLTHTASSFANTIATTTIHPTTTLATTTAVVAKIGDTPLSMTSTAPIYNTSNHSSPSSPLEHSMRFRSLNESNRRKIGSGLITIFCIAAIVILILC